jgi:hypothetical protein
LSASSGYLKYLRDQVETYATRPWSFFLEGNDFAHYLLSAFLTRVTGKGAWTNGLHINAVLNELYLSIQYMADYMWQVSALESNHTAFDKYSPYFSGRGVNWTEAREEATIDANYCWNNTMSPYSMPTSSPLGPYIEIGVEKVKINGTIYYRLIGTKMVDGNGPYVVMLKEAQHFIAVHTWSTAMKSHTAQYTMRFLPYNYMWQSDVTIEGALINTIATNPTPRVILLPIPH